MADYSIPPQDQLLANLQKGYVGLHIQQGVPLLDRDLNLLHDLISATMRSLFTRYIGNGIPAGADGFAIQALASPLNIQDFGISAGVGGGPGTCLVGGIEVTIPSAITYKAQAGAPVLTTPTPAQPDPRTDIVYLDVFFTEVDGTVDSDLKNLVDIGIQTSVRVKPGWAVRVSEAVPVPTAPAGHVFYPLAQLHRPRNVNAIDATMITDLRQRRLTASDLERRLALMERLLAPGFIPTQLGDQFTPKLGQPGQPVNLAGHNFNLGNVTVAFGGQSATIVGAAADSLIATTVPAGAPLGLVKITVTTDGGTAVSDESFNVLAPPPPPPAPAFAAPGAQFAPKLGPANQPVNLSGTNFDQPGLQVTIGGVACPLNGVVTAISIPIKIPVGVVPGPKPFIVTTVGGTKTSTDLFTVS